MVEKHITDFYKLEGDLGSGSFATVKRATNKRTGEKVAIKIISKQQLSEEDKLGLQNEIDILTHVDHPNIVKLYEVFEDVDSYSLVMELMTGGELFDTILEKELYTEKEAAETVRPIIDAINYCHSLNIIHRDIKPENLLYSSKNATLRIIKVSDFGLARFISSETLATTTCGTPGYVAPEILEQRPYGKECDYWSIGVVLYILLCGFPPFYDEDNMVLFEKIKHGKYDFPSPVWDQISTEAKDLIRNLLVVDPSRRFNCDELLRNSWILGETCSDKNLKRQQ
jgi:calcium/calmodulin-dependent protein kinase I